MWNLPTLLRVLTVRNAFAQALVTCLLRIHLLAITLLLSNNFRVVPWHLSLLLTSGRLFFRHDSSRLVIAPEIFLLLYQRHCTLLRQGRMRVIIPEVYLLFILFVDLSRHDNLWCLLLLFLRLSNRVLVLYALQDFDQIVGVWSDLVYITIRHFLYVEQLGSNSSMYKSWLTSVEAGVLRHQQISRLLTHWAQITLVEHIDAFIIASNNSWMSFDNFLVISDFFLARLRPWLDFGGGV